MPTARSIFLAVLTVAMVISTAMCGCLIAGSAAIANATTHQAASHACCDDAKAPSTPKHGGDSPYSAACPHCGQALKSADPAPALPSADLQPIAVSLALIAPPMPASFSRTTIALPLSLKPLNLPMRLHCALTL